MDAGYRFLPRNLVLAAIFAAATLATTRAADFRTQNFLVMAPSQELAQAVGQAAETYRNDLAVHWLGRPLPPWQSPCPIRVIAGNMPAQGVTQYNRAPVRDFQMEVVGTPERILDSVLPHEVTHTILATHFGRPLPRWADEGICTTVEHESERAKHEQKLREFLRSRRGIAMNKLFLLTEYPDDVLPMYAQGYSVCQFLIAQRGPQQFVTFLGDYMQRPSWTENIRQHYGYDSLAELQEQWLAWVSVGNGPVDRFAKIEIRPANADLNATQGIASMPVTSRVAQAGAIGQPLVNQPGSEPRSNLATAPIDHLAGRTTQNAMTGSSSEDGWYSRLRREAVANPSANLNQAAVNPGRRNDPPSLYSAAQPQPEQGLAPSGAVAPLGMVTPAYPDNRFPPTGNGGQPMRPTEGSYWR
jgi:hypothetical protein